MLPERVSSIKPFWVMDILQRAKELERKGASIIHLEVGEPDFNTHPKVINKVKKFIETEKIGYTHSLGIPELREAISQHYKKTYKVKVEPDRIIITNGTSPAFLIALGVLIEKEEEVLLSNPHYPCYPSFITFIGARPKFITVTEDNGFQFEINELKKNITRKTKGIFINSPANPTGSIIPREILSEIADLDIWIFSDEIYHGLNYESEVHTVLEFTDKCIVFNGFSKLYAMTGWRLGYMIVPKHLVSKIEALVQNFFISPNVISQWAGYVALTDEEVSKDLQKVVSTYNSRRKFILKKLKEMNFNIKVEPQGAFYVFVNAKKFMNTKNSYEFAIELLENTHVAVTPGTDFGSQGEGYIRLSYANSIENISKALNKIAHFLKIV